MRTRKVYLLKDDTFTAAQTKVVNINVADFISSIDILIEMTNGGTMTEASIVKPHDEFTKIELIDGADVLVSASMEELQALNFAETGRAPMMHLTLATSGVQQEMCHIHFGVAPTDGKHYLRPQEFNNLQLRITNTFTTAAATSWAATGHTISVIANVIEEGAEAYEGFLTAKSMYTFTAVDAAVETIDMPRDYPYRFIQIQSLMSGKTPQENIEKIKLTFDADKYVPVDLDFDHLVFENVKRFGPITQFLQKVMTNAADKMYADVYYDVWATVGGGTTLYATHVLSVTGEQVVAETYAQTA